MTYESLRSVFLYTGIASLILAAVSVVLFFALKIPDAIAFITGYSRKKGVRRIENEGANDSNGMKTPEKAKKKAEPKNRNKKKEQTVRKDPASGQRDQADAAKAQLEGAEQTDLLSSASDATSLLMEDHGAPTAQLTSAPTESQEEPAEQPFDVAFEITFLNSDVIIE